MTENYQEAAVRHWEDAELLNGQNRPENADHHYGFAAECALKWALRSIGNLREEEHRKHINVLWDRMRVTRYHRHFPNLAKLLSGPNRFADWDVEQRYYGDGAITREALRLHRQFARRLLGAVNLY